MAAPIKSPVSISTVSSLDIRVGTIRAIEGVPGSRKLARMTVSLGDHERTILAGLKAERADLQVLVGRQTLFVVNLEPKEMAGVVSQGMLLDIGYPDGINPVLAIPEAPVPDGTRLG